MYITYKVAFITYSLTLIGFLLIVFMWSLGMSENAHMTWLHYLFLLYTTANILLLGLYHRIIAFRNFFALINFFLLLISAIFFGTYIWSIDWSALMIISSLLFYYSVLVLSITMCKEIISGKSS